MNVDVGNTQRLIQQMQSNFPGAGALDHGRSGISLPPTRRAPSRHGPAEQDSGSRTSRRERERSLPRAPATATRVGSQVGMDFDERFTAIEDRLDTLERHQRMNAQPLRLASQLSCQGLSLSDPESSAKN